LKPFFISGKNDQTVHYHCAVFLHVEAIGGKKKEDFSKIIKIIKNLVWQ
jgi:hypothetical protein